MKKLFTAAVLLVMTTMSANAQDTHLVINELMQSNVECLFDDVTKEFPDSWVELYNPTDDPINLGDYKIGTKNKVDKAWQLPDSTVASKGHVVIYCDKEGIAGSLHTDFRLESGKDGNLYLFQGNEIVDQLVKMAKMPAPDVAYGRAEDGGEAWGYQLTPSPGATNTGIVPADHKILGAPGFSEEGRVGNATVSLTLSVPNDTPEGTVICYTTDGSEPTAIFNSETNRFVPTGSSMLYNNTTIDITTTTVIRAKLLCKNYLSPVSTAQSYIFRDNMTVPIISIQTNNRYINDATIGIYPNNTGKYDKVDWRRPINIEMFKKAGEASVINQLGETRIQGGKSRENALKSMAIYANKRFDPVKKRFDYEFFPDQKPGVSQFKSFSLRNGGNDFGDLYFRDLIVQRTMGENTDIDWQAGHTAALYINGVYKGMLNIRERSNADNIYSNYDGLEDIDMIEISHEEDANKNDLFIEELKEGDLNNYNAFKEFYSETGHTLADYEQWMDVSEYLNTVIMNLFYGNNDWPGNNTIFWRPRTDAGRWRVVAKDTDFGLGLYDKSNNYNMIDLFYNPNNHPGDKWAFTEPATRLLKNMLEDPGILNLFIDKCCVYMGDFMNGEGTGKIIDKIQAEALDEFVVHRAVPEYHVWGGSSRQELINKFNNAKNWAEGRPNYFIQHIQQQFQEFLRGNNPNDNITPISVTINKELDSDKVPDEVLVNGIKLTQGVFNGKLFKNRQITLEGKTKVENDMIVTGWEIKMTKSNNQVVTTNVYEPTYTFTVPSCNKLVINAIMGEDPRAKVTIGKREAVSFSSTKALDFTDQPVEAFIVTAKNGNTFAMKQVYTVPAQTGLVIEGAEGVYKIPVAESNTFDNISGNLLQSTATQKFTVTNDLEGRVYGLFYSFIQEKVGFQKKDAGFEFGLGKSYLLLPESMAEANINEIFCDETTAIQGVYNNTWTDDKAYNLNGQRVDKNYKGIIIMNGKKVVNNRK